MAHGAEEYDAGVAGGAYLTAEKEEQLVNRLYTQSLSRREAALAELDARYYPVAAPQRITTDALQKSVERQVDAEMERRQQRRREMDAQVVAEATGHANNRAAAAAKTVLTPEGAEASVHRLYDETLMRTKAKMAESQRLYAFHPESVKTAKMSKEALQESVKRMSNPKKTEFSIAEVNKIYGL